MAETRGLAGFAEPEAASSGATAMLVPLESEALIGSLYVSLVPTTMSRDPSWSMSPIAGESMIFSPRNAQFVGPGLPLQVPASGVTLWVPGSIDTRVGSATTTGKPGRGV